MTTLFLTFGQGRVYRVEVHEFNNQYYYQVYVKRLQQKEYKFLTSDKGFVDKLNALHAAFNAVLRSE